MDAKTVSIAVVSAALGVVMGPSAHANDSELEDVIVTANRRPELLSKVAVSVTSIDAASLQVRGVTLSSDLPKLVPGLSIADTGINLPTYSIRGIGLNDSSLASNSTVTLSVDEVPLPYAAMTQGALLDLERVEVLKGPQGTLYGLNATGGAINYIANKPTDEPSFGGQLGYGSFDTASAEFYVGGRLSQTLKARWSLNGTLADNWQRSLTHDGELGRLARSATRLLLSWEPTEKLSIDFNGNGWLDRSHTQATQVAAFRALTPANIPLLLDVFSSPILPADARAADWNPERDYGRDDDFFQLSLQTKYRLSEHTDLKSISAWSRYDSAAFNDRDGIAPESSEFATRAEIDSHYQELRLSGMTEALQWSAGANFRKDSTYDSQVADVTRSSNTFVGNLKLNRARLFSAQDVKSYAAFADGELALAPRLSVMAGVRYTHDRREFTGSTCDDGAGDFAAVFTLLSNEFRSGAGLPPLPAISPGQCVTLSAVGFDPGIVHDTMIEDNVSFRSGLGFRPTQESLLSASFSRGFKAGSFPTLSAVSELSYAPATQERVDALEVGFRTAHFDRRLRLNGTAFRYDYHDKQFRAGILDPGFGLLVKLSNIPRSTIKGAEIEVAASPFSGLTLDVAASYIKTEVTRFTGINLLGQSENFSGQTLPYTPPWSVNAGGQFNWTLGKDLNTFMGVGYTYRSRTSGYIGRDQPLDVDEYATIDFRAGVESGDDRWRVSIWGTNVTNRHYWTSAEKHSDTIIRYAARPSMYGVLLTFKH